jgi:DNA polymerase III alpha subunit
VVGILSSIKKIATKNGQPMVFATLADMHDSMEVIIFSDSLQKNPIAWQENKVLVVSGRMSARNGEYKMICEAAKDLV